MDKDVSYSGLLLKSLKVLYVVLGFLPAFWLTAFMAVVSLGFFKLGTFPSYSQTSGPVELGLQSYAMMTLTLGAMSLIAMIAWPVLVLAVYFSKYKSAVLIRNPFIAFAAGLAGYLLLRFAFADLFDWVGKS